MAGLVAGLVALFTASAAHAGLPGGACPDGEAAVGPLAGASATAQPADFGAVPEACPGTDLLLRLRGELVDASGAPDVFRRITGSGTARGRRRLGARGWISIAVDLTTYRYANNAGLASGALSFGPATIGYHRTFAARPTGALAAYARALLPIDTARQNGIATGGELGLAGRAHLSGRWTVDGGVSLATPVDVTAGQGHVRLEPSALAEAWFAPRPRFALFGGAAVRLEAVPTVALFTVAPRLGLRGLLPHGFAAALLAEAPVAGTDRTSVIASVFVGWTPPR